VDRAPDHRIEVTGTATRRVDPDQVAWVIQVVEREGDEQMVFERCALRANTVTEALEAALADEGQIKPRGVRLAARWDARRQREEGVQAEATIGVTTPVGRAGEAARVAMDAGADRVEGPRFIVSDAVERREGLIGEAVEVARRKAERAATAAGRGLGPAAVIVEGAERGDWRFAHDGEAVAAAGGGGVDPRVEPDEQILSATVRVTFEMEG
jgi:uncharacterized protein YggE